MSTNKIFFLSMVLLGLAGCAKDTFVSHTGNMPAEDKVSQLSKGMSRQQVRELLGSPSSIVSLDRDTWIYMSSEIEQIAFMPPKEIERRLLVLKFDGNGQVADIQHVDKTKGQELEVSKKETETVEQEQGFFRKYFGGVGQFTPFGGNKPIDK